MGSGSFGPWPVVQTMIASRRSISGGMGFVVYRCRLTSGVIDALCGASVMAARRFLILFCLSRHQKTCSHKGFGRNLHVFWTGCSNKTNICISLST